mgnify:FL=1
MKGFYTNYPYTRTFASIFYQLQGVGHIALDLVGQHVRDVVGEHVRDLLGHFTPDLVGQYASDYALN